MTPEVASDGSVSITTFGLKPLLTAAPYPPVGAGDCLRRVPRQPVAWPEDGGLAVTPRRGRHGEVRGGVPGRRRSSPVGGSLSNPLRTTGRLRDIT